MDLLDVTDPPLVAGHRLLARLGSGGMGRVYLARSPTGRLVALKVMLPELARSDEFRARFRREIAATGAVCSDYVAQLLGADPDADPPWLATRYVPGPSLAEAVRRSGGLPSRTVTGLAAGAVRALLAVQRAGLVHQDLKPSNLLIDRGRPRLIDFGVAGPPQIGRRREVMVGTPAFMAPEQIEGGPIDTATDVFSLGGVLTFALTGTGPFGHGQPWELLERVLYRAPDLAAVPGAWRPLLRWCLAKHPADRPTLPVLLTTLAPGRPARRRSRPGRLPSSPSRPHTLRPPAPLSPPRPDPPRPLPRRRPRAWPVVVTLVTLGAMTVPTAVAQVAPPSADGRSDLGAALSLPPPYMGTWSGTVRERSRGRAYPVRIALLAGATGSVVGTIDYWTRPCRGRLWLEEVSAGSVRITEEITWGAHDCAPTASLELAVRADGTLDYLSDAPGEPERVEGTLASDRLGPTGWGAPGPQLGSSKDGTVGLNGGTALSRSEQKPR